MIETQAGLIPVEVKASATARTETAEATGRFRRDFGDRVQTGYVIHPGKSVLPLGGGVMALPIHAL